MIGKYKRTGWQRRKASITMKKIWANRRKSAAMKAWHANNAKSGGVHPVWKTPYRNTDIAEMHKAGLVTTSVLESLFGPNVQFKDLTQEQKRQYWAATDKRRKTPRTMKVVPVVKLNKAQTLMISIVIEGNKAELKDIRLAPSQSV